MATVARNNHISRTAVKQIADKEYSNPTVFNDILKEERKAQKATKKKQAAEAKLERLVNSK